MSGENLEERLRILERDLAVLKSESVSKESFTKLEGRVTPILYIGGAMVTTALGIIVTLLLKLILK